MRPSKGSSRSAGYFFSFFFWSFAAGLKSVAFISRIKFERAGLIKVNAINYSRPSAEPVPNIG